MNCISTGFTSCSFEDAAASDVIQCCVCGLELCNFRRFINRRAIIATKLYISKLGRNSTVSFTREIKNSKPNETHTRTNNYLEVLVGCRSVVAAIVTISIHCSACALYHHCRGRWRREDACSPPAWPARPSAFRLLRVGRVRA